jgi:hypothetical protein
MSEVSRGAKRAGLGLACHGVETRRGRSCRQGAHDVRGHLTAERACTACAARGAAGTRRLNEAKARRAEQNLGRNMPRGAERPGAARGMAGAGR